MLLAEKFCSLTTFLSNQLHLSKLNGVLGSETSDSSSDYPNFPCPFCTQNFDERAEVVEHLDTCVGTEDQDCQRLNLVQRYKHIGFSNVFFSVQKPF